MPLLYRIFPCLLFAGIFVPASAQVINDSIAHRLKLPLNQPIHSTTAYCTVEENCVDEQLTGKCIEYHNDQWFYFTAADIPTHYLTVTGQHCREVRGVQLVLLSGEPCQPETYQVLDCISLASQEDIYLKSDSLETGKTYLLNIDGYLHDFCSFTITYSNSPAGISAKEAPEGILSLQQQERKLDFSWQTPQYLLDNTLQYELYRREAREKKFKEVEVVNHDRNAYGVSRDTYSTTDSLTAAGNYFYKLLARLKNGESIPLAEVNVKQQASTKTENILDISLPPGKKVPFTILIFDAQKQQLLEKRKGITKNKEQKMPYKVGQWQKQGIRLFRVLLINEKNGEQKEWLFSR